MRRFFIILVLLTGIVIPAYAKAVSQEITVSNKLFSINLPEASKDDYRADKKKTSISIFEKESYKGGFGGFAFGIFAYKNPSDYAMSPGGSKLGELTDKKGKLYDIVLMQPTDVQFDYEKGTNEKYMRLYEFRNDVEITGVKGSAYVKNAGMKGEDLYKEVLLKHKKAIKEKYDSAKLEAEDMSYMYNVLSKTTPNVLNKIGYAYYDVNGDGIEELFIGEITQGAQKGIVYDIYTMVNRKPVHVVSGGSRNRYYVCSDYFICNEYSSGANESGTTVYDLVQNSTELYPQIGFIYDGYSNKKQPWYITYGSQTDQKENVTQKVFNERKKGFTKYKRFDFIPLSKVK